MFPNTLQAKCEIREFPHALDTDKWARSTQVSLFRRETLQVIYTRLFSSIGVAFKFADQKIGKVLERLGSFSKSTTARIEETESVFRIVNQRILQDLKMNEQDKGQRETKHGGRHD